MSRNENSDAKAQTPPNYLSNVRDCIRLAVPQATEWQRIANQIDAAMI
jgi:hypothetical protein